MPRAAEITYYDELGVPPNAAPEQIRDSFRSLVRLLHPDQQTDEQLKEIAELQMRKLNRIYSVLSDPDRRRRYDDSLEQDDRLPTIVFNPSRNIAISSKTVARLSWFGASVVIIGLLIWLASDSPAIMPLQTSEHESGAQRILPAVPAGKGEPSGEVAQLRSDLRTALAERDAAIRELARVRNPSKRAAARSSSTDPVESAGTSMPQSQAPVAMVTELPASQSRPVMPVGSPPPALKPVSTKQFGGFWFYSRPPQGQRNKNAALYPPEFIEASITEQNGTVHGRYRSRYQIVDRPISPDVNFEFKGVPSGTTLKCAFTGQGGARGELTLQLTSENVLTVEWATTELGSIQGLASGTAKLSRRID